MKNILTSKKKIAILAVFIIILIIYLFFNKNLPDSSQNEEWIVFNCWMSGNHGSAIFRVNPDGKKLEKLVDFDANAYFPEWSPDGSTIIFRMKDGGLYIMKPDGSNIQVFGGENHYQYGDNPRWSPDGEFIAYQSGNRIVIVDRTGYLQQKTITLNADSILLGEWSPDGNWLFVRLSYIETKAIQYLTINTENMTLQEFDENSFDIVQGLPIWAPSKTKILITVQEDVNTSPNIGIFDVENQEFELLTDKMTNGYTMYPYWSPDESKFAFVSGKYFQGGQLFVMDLNTQRTQQLTNLDCTVGPPRWKPY